jgi:hypothetical protein
MASATSVIASVLLLFHGATAPASPERLLLTQAKPSKSMNCHITGRDPNRDNTRIKCVYKCPNGKMEAEIIPKGASCPAYINVPQ